MKPSSKIAELTKIIAPAVAVCDVALWGVEFTPQGKRSMLRIYIDSLPDSDVEGVTIDDCASVTHQVSGVLEVHDPIAGEYTLEVSSPGVDRVFFTAQQMQDYIGETIHVRLIHGITCKSGGRRKLQGTLNSVDERALSLTFEGEEVEILLDNIDKAHLVYQFD